MEKVDARELKVGFPPTSEVRGVGLSTVLSHEAATSRERKRVMGCLRPLSDSLTLC